MVGVAQAHEARQGEDVGARGQGESQDQGQEDEQGRGGSQEMRGDLWLAARGMIATRTGSQCIIQPREHVDCVECA